MSRLDGCLKASEPLKNAVVVGQNLIPQGVYGSCEHPRKERHLSRQNHSYPRFLNCFFLIACLWITVGFPNRAFGQVPCGFDITHVIQGPSGGWPNPPLTVGIAISPNGRYVCGYYEYVIDNYAFVFDTQTGQFTTLPLTPSAFTIARDVNDAGLVVGQAASIAFIYNLNSGQVTYVPPVVNGNGSGFSAINASGVACGTRSISVNPTIDNAFIWSVKGGVLDLGIMSGPSSSATDINDNGTVVGHLGVGQRLFLWHAGQVTYFDTLPDTETYALAINIHNEFVGRIGYFVPTFTLYGFIWTPNGMTNLGTLPGDVKSNANSINDLGIVVGRSQGLASDRAYIWHDGVMKPISDFIHSTEGVALIDGNDINNSNMVVAAGRLQAGGFNVGVVLEPVLPAPADIDMNCRVDIGDLLAIIGDWGKSKSPADVNGDGIVNILDLLFVIENWG